MPAPLVPHAAIPDLAAQVTGDLLVTLQKIQKSGFIRNGPALAPEVVGHLARFAELGLVDPAWDGEPVGPPSMWVSNGNGSRVVGYLTGIRGGPHYEIAASDLGAWLEEQGNDRWWNVDGDPLLTGRMTFPAPAADLAAALRTINRPLLVQAKKEDGAAQGQTIGKEKLNDVVGTFAENVHAAGEEQVPQWGNDRLLYLCWKDRPYEWLLAEDSEAAEQAGAGAAAEAE